MSQPIEHIKQLLNQALDALPPTHHHLIDEIHQELFKLKKQLTDTTSEQAKATMDAATGCYQFEHDAGLYCPHCYDRQQIRVNTQRINSRLRVCPQCRSSLKAAR